MKAEIKFKDKNNILIVQEHRRHLMPSSRTGPEFSFFINKSGVELYKRERHINIDHPTW